jgi:hypothetical protein
MKKIKINSVQDESVIVETAMKAKLLLKDWTEQ